MVCNSVVASGCGGAFDVLTPGDSTACFFCTSAEGQNPVQAAFAMGRPGPKPGTTRKKQRTGRKQGKDFSLEKKDHLQAGYGACGELLSSNGGSVLFRGKKVTTVARLFELLYPGHSASTARAAALGKKKGTLGEPKKKGPAPKQVEEVIAEGEWAGDFVGWLVHKVENAKKGSFVTIDSLKRDLQVEAGEVVSKRFLRRTLKRLGFRYVKRKGMWISRRNEERIVRRLWEFCKWAVANSTRTQVAGGKKKFRYEWNRPVGFQDETFIQDGEFRKHSWCAPHPGSKRVDNFYDVGTGKGTRINVIHTIFAANGPQPVTAAGVPACLVHWKSSWTGKQHKYKGETVTGEHITKYFCEEVFHCLQGGRVWVDNASTHKVYTEAMHEMDATDLENHIETKISQAKNDYRGKFVKEQWQKLKGKYVDSVKESKLRDFIRKHNLMDTVLSQKGDMYNVEVAFLAQYHPEANPIERYWALLKRKYYDTDPKLPHQTRMSQALAKIPDDFVGKCIEKSLEWVWKKHEELAALPKFGGPAPAVVVGDAALEGIESSSSDSDSDCGF